MFFIYMHPDNTLENVINNNVFRNFIRPSYFKNIEMYSKEFHDVLFKMTNELCKIERYIQCNNIHGLLNVLNELDSFTTYLTKTNDKMIADVSTLSLSEYIKLKETIAENILPVYNNIYNYFITIINKYNIEIRNRVLHYLKNEGYDIEKSLEKYNEDINGLNDRLFKIKKNMLGIILFTQ